MEKKTIKDLKVEHPDEGADMAHNWAINDVAKLLRDKLKELEDKRQKTLEDLAQPSPKTGEPRVELTNELVIIISEIQAKIELLKELLGESGDLNGNRDS